MTYTKYKTVFEKNETTPSEVRKKLIKHYAPGDRELKRKILYCNYDTAGAIFFGLNGSPPKGYALYIPSKEHLSLYDLNGKRFRIMRETKLEGFTKEDLKEENQYFAPGTNIEGKYER